MSQIKLIRVSDKKIIFEGAYVKYYPDPSGMGLLPYCAIFKEYPAVETVIRICKRTDADDAFDNMNVCRLYNQGKDVGYYIPTALVGSEKEANNRIAANMKAVRVIRAAGRNR